MKTDDLHYDVITAGILKPYSERSPIVSAQFLRWFLENIFRLDRQDADDACVDAKQDKGIDGIYVNDVTETIYLIQTKVRQKQKATLGDTDLKEFHGSISQFSSASKIQAILAGNANSRLKQAISRNKLADKVDAGFAVEGLFCTNVLANKEAVAFLDGVDNITLYDADAICDEYLEIGADSGVKDVFNFNVADTDVIAYSSNKVSSRIFLADALQLIHLKGIADGTLFEKNVRLSLGNTKVNKALIASIKNKKEHRNFPLYHNGINILCEELTEEDESVSVKNYMVVNGAQSLTSLYNTKSSISDDLKILVKIVETKGDAELSDKITTNSNNQNAIKPRDMRSNHGIQQRLKREVSKVDPTKYSYEVKRGEKSKAAVVISNEDAGLALLALDLGQPWSCHQKYKVMDELHGEIFGRPDVNGWKIVALIELLSSVEPSLSEIDDKSFAYYNLTRYFVAYAVSEIIRDSKNGKKLFSSLKNVIEDGNLPKLVGVFENVAKATALDLNAEVVDVDEDDELFDHKSSLKSPNWCRATVAKLKASYKKDVVRKRAKAIDELIAAFV
ncbi:MAG TPA: AIPR family protein [Devosiaceae bacterium]|jgi:hypothetical protein|nr:AIPR family protein [Devosiaceae bacterium]